MHKNRSVLAGVILFIFGGCLYVCIELLWRRRSHWSMFLIGGACFHMIGQVFSRLKKKCLLLRCLLSSVLVTGVEFLSGCILNLKLGLRVWDYTDRRMNAKGQICMLYSIYWFLLSIPAGFLYKVCQKRFTCCKKGKKRT